MFALGLGFFFSGLFMLDLLLSPVTSMLLAKHMVYTAVQALAHRVQ
jgi:hypothetical protein